MKDCVMLHFIPFVRGFKVFTYAQALRIQLFRVKIEEEHIHLVYLTRSTATNIVQKILKVCIIFSFVSFFLLSFFLSFFLSSFLSFFLISFLLPFPFPEMIFTLSEHEIVNSLTFCTSTIYIRSNEREAGNSAM